MDRSQLARFEMLQRTRDFGTAHRERFPESSPGAAMFATMAAIVAEIDALATSKIVIVREARRVKADRREVIVDRMRTIARSSRGIRSESGAPLRLNMPDRTSDAAIVRGARAFLQEAERYQDQLIPLGLPATYFAELREATDAFDAALKQRRTGRSDIAAANAGIKAGLERGMETARLLDIIVANAAGKDPVVMAAWNRDRRLVGARRARTTEPATAATTPNAAEPASPTTAATPEPTDGLSKAS